MSETRQATLYRMVLPDHTCPFGVRAKSLLEGQGYKVDDHILRSRSEVEAFMADEGIATTPLIYLGDRRVGGCDELERQLSSGE